MGDLILAAAATILQKLFVGFASWLIQLMAGLQANALKYADSHATHHVLTIIIPVALVMLMVRMLYGIVHDYMIHDSAGINTTPTQILKGAALAACGMAASSLLVRAVWDFFAQISLAIAGLGLYSHGASILNGAIAAVIANFGPAGGIELILVLFEYGAAIIILFIAVIQTFVRIADLALYLMTGPLAAIGLVSRTQGAWAGWWKGLIVLAGSQTAQLAMIYFGFGAMTSMGFATVDHIAAHAAVGHITVSTMLTAPMILIGALLASLKGADFVKQMGGYSTGVGGMASQHGATLISSRIGKK